MSLYDSAINALRQQATREFRQSSIGRVFNEVERMKRRGTAGHRELRRLSRNLDKLRNSSVLREEMKRTGVGQLIGEVDRYARRGIKEIVLDHMLGALGPVGGLIGMFLRPQGKPVANINRELKAASDLLRAFGYNVDPPASPLQGDKAVGSKIEESKEFLESLGFRVEPPSPERSKPPIPQPGGQTSFVTMGGLNRTLSPDDPMVTGAWVAVSSSNVDAIGFIWNDANPSKGTLKVRFRNHRKNATSPRGSVYHYYDVHPSQFDNFRRSASKGRWVWDHLRIRGTVSGHQYRYALAMLGSDGYVPRQATRLGPKEYFLRRSVTAKDGRQFQSELSDQFVKFFDSRRSGAPNRARPNRGRPDRGTPDRGEPNRG